MRRHARVRGRRSRTEVFRHQRGGHRDDLAPHDGATASGGWGGNLRQLRRPLTLDHVRSTSGDAYERRRLRQRQRDDDRHAQPDRRQRVAPAAAATAAASPNIGTPTRRNLTVRHSTIAGNRVEGRRRDLRVGARQRADITTRLEHVDRRRATRRRSAAVGGIGNGVTARVHGPRVGHRRQHRRQRRVELRREPARSARAPTSSPRPSAASPRRATSSPTRSSRAFDGETVVPARRHEPRRRPRGQLHGHRPARPRPPAGRRVRRRRVRARAGAAALAARSRRRRTRSPSSRRPWWSTS